MSVRPELQQSLFPYPIEEIIKHLKLNTSTAVLWHKNEYLSYNIEEKKEINHTEQLELIFIHSLFYSGLSLKSIDNLLIGLEKPYAYDPLKVYYDFADKGWKYFPEQFELNSENYFEEISSLLDVLDIEEEKATLQLLIENLEERLSEIKQAD